jgi:hypothetical protein
MAPKKQESFTVTDRRLFTTDGDLRQETQEEEQIPTSRVTAEAAPAPDPTPAAEEVAMPPLPTVDEQQAQADAYKKSSKELDTRVELSGHSSKELEMTFERFLASLYMSAMLQLGLMQEERGQPRVDIIGARQTIDTLSLIAEKTKNNLTAAEQGFLQNSLYEVRMAYVEVTNALAHPPKAPAKITGT